MDLLREAGGKRLVTVPEQIPPQLQLPGTGDSPGPPTRWLLPGLLLPLRGLLVLSEDKLLSLQSLSLPSRDVASSSISLRCGCEVDSSGWIECPRK